MNVCVYVNRSLLNLKMPWRQTRRSCSPWWRLWSYKQNNWSLRPRTILTRVSLCTTLNCIHSYAHIDTNRDLSIFLYASVFPSLVVSRLEERESDMKKEYNALHQRHTEVRRTPFSAFFYFFIC